jgi:phosphoglycolate phosphatase
MQRRFDLVIFDLDGTLVDNRVAIRENFNHALAVYGFPRLKDDKIDAMIGTPLIEMFAKTLPAPSKHLAPKLVDAYVQRYLCTSHVGTVVLESVTSTLERLKEDGFKLAVATTKANETVQPLLQRIGLDKYFDLTTGRREGMRNKPHPDMLNFVTKTLGVKSERTVMVGDTPVDVMTARNAGIYVVVVTSSVALRITTLNMILESRPDMTISSLQELPDILYI